MSPAFVYFQNTFGIANFSFHGKGTTGTYMTKAVAFKSVIDASLTGNKHTMKAAQSTKVFIWRHELFVRQMIGTPETQRPHPQVTVLLRTKRLKKSKT